MLVLLEHADGKVLRTKEQKIAFTFTVLEVKILRKI
jgi:hypothetical protein